MKQIRIDFNAGEGGIGYRIDPTTQTYSSGPLKDGELVEPIEKGEYGDAQKFATQLYWVVLTALKEQG